MRLYIVSDLHREFESWEPPEFTTDDSADVVILAGDIDWGVDGVRWARRAFANRPVIYVAGNHEFYGEHWTEALDAMRNAAAGSNVRFLEDATTVIDGVRFIGATLWTDFAYFGRDQIDAAMEAARWGMNDFTQILVGDRDGWKHHGQWPKAGLQRLHPRNVVQRFEASRAFIAASLAEPFAGPTVVVTHHLPHPRSVLPQYVDDPLTPAFVSDLGALIERYQPALWVHGHTHGGSDYCVGKTRVVCNPKGYPVWDGSSENATFDEQKTVDV